MSPRNVGEAMPMKNCNMAAKEGLYKITRKDANVKGRIKVPHSEMKNYRQLRDVENRLSGIKWSDLKSYTYKQHYTDWAHSRYTRV